LVMIEFLVKQSRLEHFIRSNQYHLADIKIAGVCLKGVTIDGVSPFLDIFNPLFELFDV